MSSKLFVLCACMLLAVVSARVTRDTAKTPEVPSFSEFFENAGKNLKELESTVLKALGVENTQQLEQKAVDQGKEFANQLDQWAQNIKKETESLKDNSAVKELRTSVDKAIEDFKLKHPDTTTDIKSFVEQANKGTEEVITKIKSLGDSEEAKNVKELSEKLLESAAKTFQNIAKDIQETVSKP